MIRGFTAVDVIVPKAAAETLVFGLLNCVVLKALKNSVRNSRLAPSRSRVSGVRLISAMSKFLWSGPKTTPTPLLPKFVATPSLPITGQMAALFGFAGLARRIQLRLK